MAVEVSGVVARLGFAVDDDGARRFERKVRDLRGDTTKPVVAELRGDIQGKDLDLYDRKLNEIRDKVRRREQFQAKLGADFDPRAFNAYERESRRTIRTTDNNVRAQGRLRTAFGSIGARGGALFAAAGGLYAVQAGLRKVTEEAEESIKVSKLTQAVIESTGGSANVTAEHVGNLANKLSLKTAQDDEAIQKGANLLLTFKEIRNEVGRGNDTFDQATAAALDLSAAGFGSIESASKQLGKALNDPLRGMTALGRAGVTFTQKQRDQIEALVETGKASDNLAAQQIILREVQSQVGGAAASQARPLDRLKVAWDNLAETIGLKLAPHVEKAAEWLSKFITQMAEGTGAGGRFVEKLEKVWDVIKVVANAFNEAQMALDTFETQAKNTREAIQKWIIRAFADASDEVLGWGSTVLGILGDIIGIGSKLPGVGGKFKGLAEDIRRAQERIDKTRESVRDLGKESDKVDMSKVRKENRQTADAFADMAKDGKVSIRDIADVTKRRSADIRKDLSSNSEEGKRALRDNFREAMGAVHRQMERGKISTKDGMEAIRGYLADELRVYGLSIAEGKKLVGKHPFAKAGGGWIGAPGMIGQDVVPAMLAPGEAVLNRHQQAVIEGMLGGGFLDQLFARVQTPHYLAGGGIVGLGRQLQREGYAVGEHPAFGGVGAGHSATSYHYKGMALDINADHMPGGEGPNLDRLYARLRRMPSVLELLWRVADHFDHLHVAMSGAGGPIGGALAQIARRVVRGGGQVGRVVQGALDTSRAGAQEFLSRATGAMSTPHPSGGGHAGNRALGRRMLGSFGWGANQFGPLNQLWTGESGWNHLARNPSSGAYGIPQCVGLETLILTRDGWKRHDEVQVGDETIGFNPATGRSEWTAITAIHHPGMAKLRRIGTKRWSATATPNHRWLTEPSERAPAALELVEQQALTRYQRLVLARPADTEGDLDITTDEAALLAWIAGDGWKITERVSVDKHGRRKHRSATFHVCQAKTEHRAAITRVIGDGGRIVRERPYTSQRNGIEGVLVEWRLSAPYARDLCARAGGIEHPRDDAVGLVLRMSDEQRAAWLEAIIAAEGHVTNRADRSPVTQITQKPGPLADAIVLAVYLSGCRPSVYVAEREDSTVWVITITKPYMGAGREGIHINEDAGEEEVWCVTTGLGTWTAQQGSHVFLTGNSLPASKMASAGGDWLTNPATQIRWGLGYIKDRYGSPAAAYSAWLSRSPHWYKRGGRVQRFQSGGRAGFEESQAGALAGAGAATGKARAYQVGRRLRRRAKRRIGAYESLTDELDSLATQYELADRRYGQSDEVLIRDDGTLDTDAVRRRADEITGLMAIRQQIIDKLDAAAAMARRIVQTYRTILRRLRRSLRHARRKDRRGIRDQIRETRGEIDAWRDTAGEQATAAQFARLDLGDLQKERAEVLGTTAEPTTERGGAVAESPNLQAIAEQATRRAESLRLELAAVRASFAAFTSTGDIGSAQGTSAFGSTLIDAAGGVGGATAAGVPGGFIAGAGGGVTVIVQSQSLLPGSQGELQRVGDAVVSVLGARPVRQPTQARVG